MSNEVFTILDVLPAQPPVRFDKPWFARGWIIGLVLALLVSGKATYHYLEFLDVPVFWTGFAAFLWLITIRKYFRGIRFIEIHTDMVWVYALNPIKPIGNIPFDRMTVIQDVDEIYFIQKAKFTGGFSLKSPYWKHDWHRMKIAFDDGASYVMRNDPTSRGGFGQILMS